MKKNKNKALKILTICALVVSLTGCFKMNTNVNVNEVTIDSEVTNTEIEEIIKNDIQEIIDTSEQQTSSGLYEYINESSAYEDILSYGEDGVVALINIIQGKEVSGLSEALALIALEEMTGMKVMETYQIEWNNAKEFVEYWKANRVEE